MDLGIGVFRDALGSTPVLGVVKLAEQRIINSQQTKAYVGLLGDLAFNRLIVELVLGADFDRSRVGAMQTPGGCSAVRNLAELVAFARPDSTVWLSQPSWENHAPIFAEAGLTVQEYPYYDREKRSLRFQEMLDKLMTLEKSDVVLLHGCCHNPTGADLSAEQWRLVAEVAGKRGFLPFVDIAYQGFGRGLTEDVAGIKCLVSSAEEAVVAVSCSKNFGLYRDRVGAAIVVSQSSASAKAMQGRLAQIGRFTYSMPPDHGAAIVKEILSDPKLTQSWNMELDAMRNQIDALRKALVLAFRQVSDGSTFDFLSAQRGMFSLLPLTETTILELRSDHGIYLADTGRINIAGLGRPDNAIRLAKALFPSSPL